MRWRSPKVPATHPLPPAPDEWEQVKVAMQEFGNWIKNADTKVTILAAALGVTISAFAARTSVFVDAIQNPHFGLKWLLYVVSTMALICVVACIVFVYCSLIPRTEASSVNRFSWSSMASNQIPCNFSNDREIVLSEAWRQCHDLAGIAKKKYAWFKLALPAFGLFVVLAASSFGIAASSR